MKKQIIIVSAAVTLLTSCSKFLDINQNPNEATSATPQLILPQAITGTASQLNGYNSSGAQMVGYMANAGGYGGFGSAVTYSFTSSDHAARWNVFDVLEDYQQILDNTTGDASMRLYSATARIMKVHGFQLLVDQYNSVPYSEALKGGKNLSPKYDDPAVIYKSLADEIDMAIDTINAALASSVAATPLTTASDPMFGGNMTSWKKFANTLKLRILVNGNGKVTFSSKNKTFDAAGFLTTDALVNPGYTRQSGKQNPKWDTWGFTYTGSDGNKAWMPNTFVMAFYNGSKLTDPGRSKALYYQSPTTPTNRLGYESTSVTSSPSGSFWYPSSNRTGATSGNATGVLKGPDAGMPVITAAESYFLQAEANVRGILTGGNVQVLFENGITASFNYLYQLPDKSLSGSPSSDASAYLTANNTSPLVNFSLATTTEQKIEAIITQKYIAMNMVNSEVGWNDYRRTHYPTIINTAGATGTQTFASTQSKSTRPDHLPTRIVYPSSEGAYNSTNMPKGIDPFSSLIFWAL